MGKKIYDVPSYKELNSTPETPPSGFWKIYPKGGIWYTLDEFGVEAVVVGTVVGGTGYAEIIPGDNSTFSFTVNHSLNSKNLMLSVYNELEENITDGIVLQLTDNNNIQIIFNNVPSNSEYFRVVIGKIG